MPAPTEIALKRCDVVVRNAEMYPPWLQPMLARRVESAMPRAIIALTPESTSHASPTPRFRTLSERNFSP